MRLRVRYTDGTVHEGTCEDWPSLRGDGVDAVWIGDDDLVHPQGTPLIGYPLYWLYAQGDVWIVGRSAVGTNEAPREYLYDTTGVTVRTLKTMPDLRHADLKIGWWR